MPEVSGLDATVVHMPLALYVIVLTILLAAVAVVATFCFSRLRRLRLMEDTPTSAIGSAAQGFVELEGRAEPARNPLVSPLRQAPCVWWSYRIEELDPSGAGASGNPVESGRSFECFLIHDASGACVVDPAHAEVVGAPADTWISGTRRFEERLIKVGQPLYAMGRFRTQEDAEAEEERKEVGELISTWQLNRLELARRFDANRNGLIDDQEWDAVWEAAVADVRQRRKKGGREPLLHVLCNPGDRRPFLISTFAQERLTNHYWFQSIVSLISSLMLAMTVLWLLQTRAAAL